MVRRSLAGRGAVRGWGDALLALQVGWFIWRAPHELGANHLGGLLRRLIEAPRPPAADLEAGVERLVRLSNAWLRRKWLRRRRTCYLRALVLFRFLDPGGAVMRFHLGVEPGQDRLHGHAWVTVAGRPVGLEDTSIPGRCALLYVYPPDGVGENLLMTSLRR
jgi:hypothetical protein